MARLDILLRIEKYEENESSFYGTRFKKLKDLAQQPFREIKVVNKVCETTNGCVTIQVTNLFSMLNL